MSNLGIIVELRTDLIDNTIRRTKQKYPIVYENKSYVYCKQHGSDNLKSFKKEADFRGLYQFISYEAFNFNRKHYATTNCVVNVRVNKFTDDKFAEWCDSRVLYEIDELKDFVILDFKQESFFKWLQSVEDPELAFLIVSIFNMNIDYLKLHKKYKSRYRFYYLKVRHHDQNHLFLQKPLQYRLHLAFFGLFGKKIDRNLHNLYMYVFALQFLFHLNHMKL